MVSITHARTSMRTFFDVLGRCCSPGVRHCLPSVNFFAALLARSSRYKQVFVVHCGGGVVKNSIYLFSKRSTCLLFSNKVEGACPLRCPKMLTI